MGIGTTSGPYRAFTVAPSTETIGREVPGWSVLVPNFRTTTVGLVSLIAVRPVGAAGTGGAAATTGTGIGAVGASGSNGFDTSRTAGPLSGVLLSGTAGGGVSGSSGGI